MPDHPPFPSPHSEAVESTELDVARAVARRAGRTVYAVHQDDDGRRRLSLERPTDVSRLSYVVRRDGEVAFGPAGRPLPPPGRTALVDAEAQLPASELAQAREQALVAGRTIFVVAPRGRGVGGTVRFEPPVDGSLRYAVRADGTLLAGAAAYAEPPAAVRDAGWLARAGAEVRRLRRLDQRASELEGLPMVDERAWMRVDRVLADDERRALRRRILGRCSGSVAAQLLREAMDRQLERLRADARRLSRPLGGMG
ncbi:MAG TPA: hypothetical protein VHQ45_01765 [Gemmatimonadaceae bacterium]|jgi:hypothetical protein|nr:hypothetical protein [Gemmatimonadaceae bacterium]